MHLALPFCFFGVPPFRHTTTEQIIQIRSLLYNAQTVAVDVNLIALVNRLVIVICMLRTGIETKFLLSKPEFSLRLRLTTAFRIKFFLSMAFACNDNPSKVTVSQGLKWLMVPPLLSSPPLRPSFPSSPLPPSPPLPSHSR